jgi:mono/diheme cytochrome c family protein
MNGRVAVVTIWALALAAAGATAFRGIDPAHAQTPTTTPASAPTTDPTTQLTHYSGFAPIAYFDTHCARCHGPGGNMYGPEFGKNLTEDQLAKAIDDMAAGPGGAPVSADELKILVKYHQAIIDKKPFVIVTYLESTGDQIALKGEVMPGATLTVGGKTIIPDQSNWAATVSRTESIEIVATKDGKSEKFMVRP